VVTKLVCYVGYNIYAGYDITLISVCFDCLYVLNVTIESHAFISPESPYTTSS